jgi:hypothetical protein
LKEKKKTLGNVIWDQYIYTIYITHTIRDRIW